MAEAKQISDLQHPETYAILRHFEQLVRQQFTTSPAVEPIIASSPNGAWNAFTFRIGTDYVIMFDERTFEFATINSDVIVALFKEVCLKLLNDGVLENYADQQARPAVYDRFADALNGRPDELSEIMNGYAAFGGTFAGWREFAGSSGPHPQSHMAVGVRDALLLYTMAHEYSHVVLGHLNETQQVGYPEQPEAKQLLYSRTMESDADCAAILLTHQAVSKLFGNVEIATVVVELMLMNVGLLGVMHRVLRTKEKHLLQLRQAVHPPAEDRRRMMIKALTIYFDGKLPRSTVNLRQSIDLLYAGLAHGIEQFTRQITDDFVDIDQQRTEFPRIY